MLNLLNINGRDVQRKNAVNNVDKSSLWAPWQNGPFILLYINKNLYTRQKCQSYGLLGSHIFLLHRVNSAKSAMISIQNIKIVWYALRGDIHHYIPPLFNTVFLKLIKHIVCKPEVIHDYCFWRNMSGKHLLGTQFSPFL